ncbi:hypothetical protein AP285_25325 [Limnospira platensis YZ]|nr:hypothetical protein AP285_25325 [Arthrospira platensis YZ]KDR55132.1 hypothetical protein APPUASWS_023830 [Arthrospira platensis str. Paraca]
MVALLLLRVGLILFAKPPILSGTLVKGISQSQKSRMPLGESIIRQAVIAAIIREIVEKPPLAFEPLSG